MFSKKFVVLIAQLVWSVPLPIYRVLSPPIIADKPSSPPINRSNCCAFIVFALLSIYWMCLAFFQFGWENYFRFVRLPLWSFNLWIVSLGLVCIWPFEFHIFIYILYSNGGFLFICERCFNLVKVFQVWSMEGYEIERDQKRVWSKERRSHHRRWWLWCKLCLPIWACFRERPPLGRVFFYLYFFLINSVWLLGKEGK